MTKKSKKQEYSKYLLYESAVQNAEGEADLIEEFFQKERGRKPTDLREDFCGTYWLCCEWVSRNSENVAWGLDISQEPTEYGDKNHRIHLSEEEQSRLTILHQDVLHPPEKKFDVIVASNFSYYTFQDRRLMRSYFEAVHKSLKSDGMFLMDHFGGPANMLPETEDRICELPSGEEYEYSWIQNSFNPITHNAKFEIHFKDPSGKKHKPAFQYDWRMWMIPELRELLQEAGFSESKIYWEDDDDNYLPTETGEDDNDCWVAYVMGKK